jgi:hypothetical protein
MDDKAMHEFALQELMLWAAFNTYYNLAVLLWQQSSMWDVKDQFSVS